MLKFIQGYINGPVLLTGAACSILALFKLREQVNFGKIELKGEGKLATVMANLSLQNEDQEKRLEATKKLLEFIQGQKKPEVADNRDIVVDHGGLKLLLQIISTPQKQNDAILENALLAIQLLVHGSSEQRHKFNAIGGIHSLFQLAISNTIKPRVRALALACLRTASRFDISKRELDDDVPFGSEASLTIAKESSEDINTLLGFLESDSQLLKSTLGVIAHATQTVQGSSKFNELNAVSGLRYHLMSMDAFVRKNALISMANIVKHSIENSIDIFDESALHLVLKSLTKDPRLNLKIKRSIVDILYAVADHYHKTGNQQGCEEFAAMFQASKMADHLSVLLYLGFASTDRYLKQKIAKLEALLTDEKFAGEALAQHMASEMADMAGRIEAQKQQEAARKQQQMMQQMMGGMGGGMGGMQGLTPQDLQMLQQMYM